MDQIKIGAFLKLLRKEMQLTQEKLAERLHVSPKTISRWETGSNLPELSMLVELAEFYGVSIPEIIKGERNSENMEKEIKETAAAMAEYSKNEVKSGKQRVMGFLLVIFASFIIITALGIFPSESSWSSIYSILGSIILLMGIALLLRPQGVKRGTRLLALLGCALLLFCTFTLSDYVSVRCFHQLPRFRLVSSYDSRHPDRITHKTLFFTAVQEYPGTPDENVYIIK